MTYRVQFLDPRSCEWKTYWAHQIAGDTEEQRHASAIAKAKRNAQGAEAAMSWRVKEVKNTPALHGLKEWRQ